MGYSCVVFDLDGTLLNTLGDLYASVNHALSAFGLPTRSLAEVRRFTGNGIGRLVRLSVPEGSSPELEEAVFSEFKRHYDEHKLDTTLPYTGMSELVDDLRSAGVSCAVVSNKADFAVQGIVRRYFPDKFDYVSGEREGVPRKPDPAMVEAALAALGKDLSQTVYVGDSEVDIETARNCGCDAIICAWGFRDRDWLAAQGATTIVGSPAELERAILS